MAKKQNCELKSKTTDKSENAMKEKPKKSFVRSIIMKFK